MTLTNLIDLIAEVAAKRATEEGRTKEETPSAGLVAYSGVSAHSFRQHAPTYSGVSAHL
ncbi:hypothetical protein [Sulfitobacter sp.]|uniref:hypothetical protein n=1 Tax=Sulfitobacter sp. TaxID=1903071 RepID=UPI003298FF98